MRRITVWLFSTVAAVVLLFSYRTSTNSGGPVASGVLPAKAQTSTASANSGTSSSGTSSAGTSSAGTSSSGNTSSGNTSSSGSSSVAKTYTGSVAQTRWGPVQVTITVSNGKITNVSVPTYPNGNGRDAEINAYALPILQQETVSAQSATIDTVSGATVTSDGYLQSLQSAIDAAHLS